MIMNIISIFTVAATSIVVGKIIVDEVKLHMACKQGMETCIKNKK